jgi:rhodanese-related sulfurtransferase
LKQVITISEEQLKKTPKLDVKDFKNNPENYTIIDIRNKSEVEEGKFFDGAISHPLNKLRETANEISKSKPIVVHCAGGYRSAAGSSIIQNELNDIVVYDLSDAVEQFKD